MSSTILSAVIFYLFPTLLLLSIILFFTLTVPLHTTSQLRRPAHPRPHPGLALARPGGGSGAGVGRGERQRVSIEGQPYDALPLTTVSTENDVDLDTTTWLNLPAENIAHRYAPDHSGRFRSPQMAGRSGECDFVWRYRAHDRGGQHVVGEQEDDEPARGPSWAIESKVRGAIRGVTAAVYLSLRSTGTFHLNVIRRLSPDHAHTELDDDFLNAGGLELEDWDDVKARVRSTLTQIANEFNKSTHRYIVLHDRDTYLLFRRSETLGTILVSAPITNLGLLFPPPHLPRPRPHSFTFFYRLLGLSRSTDEPRSLLVHRPLGLWLALILHCRDVNLGRADRIAQAVHGRGGGGGRGGARGLQSGRDDHGESDGDEALTPRTLRSLTSLISPASNRFTKTRAIWTDIPEHSELEHSPVSPAVSDDSSVSSTQQEVSQWPKQIPSSIHLSLSPFDTSRFPFKAGILSVVAPDSDHDSTSTAPVVLGPYVNSGRIWDSYSATLIPSRPSLSPPSRHGPSWSPPSAHSRSSRSSDPPTSTRLVAKVSSPDPMYDRPRGIPRVTEQEIVSAVRRETEAYSRLSPLQGDCVGRWLGVYRGQLVRLGTGHESSSWEVMCDVWVCLMEDLGGEPKGDEVRRAAETILASYAAIHSLGVIHGDVGRRHVRFPNHAHASGLATIIDFSDSQCHPVDRRRRSVKGDEPGPRARIQQARKGRRGEHNVFEEEMRAYQAWVSICDSQRTQQLSLPLKVAITIDRSLCNPLSDKRSNNAHLDEHQEAVLIVRTTQSCNYYR
ncbi:hypothetical protein TREMEDRAFT_66428 [Tremella mesenterica DSM 1558]|uniref:uncharacterized protein n=1 Tax=Tremella mesenterica (strain ATCC 24925 / CBS 8224 / DSM 1558 / NBRC 9311 / NRRL Y-6157 / RJB 2259-6 / UBC 559-6) TaxID=578456 RepID=UPI00032CEAAD|nr:uncharacterized protein TREMEDRAFT_66428 [Tremella mesenterica DSM 1558]EIW65598.1 hypothetical protein TREMEDRAFT_66428 [Tremella mesenterica DSM 1558]